MLDNNLLFSLILSIINTVAFYFIRSSDDIPEEKRNQELLMLFGITFVTSFLLKLYLSGDLIKSGGKDNILTHSSRAPF